MKSHFLFLLAILLFTGDAFTQTKKTSRTKRKPHSVDSVSTWGIKGDSTRQYDRKDTVDMPHTNMP